MTKNTEQNTYDEMPYQSYPFAQTSPESLATLATLFGMNPPKIETARVLELGCAEGGNIIPHAIHHPKGKYVGIDLSKVQIDTGLVNVKQMGLKNIELKHCSITDIGESFGKFDYIICHGVFSWVSDIVRKKILEISSKNLTENGIAYISYNTLPGWNMVRTIRDMMLYHSKGFSSPNDKVVQSRALLKFVQESLEGSETSYAKMLANETELLSKQADSYIRHEHLEGENHQFYFSEFMEEAAKNNLQYLSDTSLSSMYLGNMGEKISEKLKDLNDIVRTEQYMDFINNRRFRSTLLCHNNVKLNRALAMDDVKKFAISFNITPEKELKKIKLESNESLKFYFNGNKDQSVSTNSPYMKAIFYTFIENIGYPLNFESVVKKANARFKTDNKKQIEIDLLKNAMNLIMKGHMQISLIEKDKSKISVDKPKLTKLSEYQFKDTNNNWLTSTSHTPVGISTFDKIAIKYMDGKNDKKQIVDKLIEEAKSGKLTMNKDNKKIEDIKEIEKALVAHLDSTITKLLTQCVLG